MKVLQKDHIKEGKNAASSILREKLILEKMDYQFVVSGI